MRMMMGGASVRQRGKKRLMIRGLRWLLMLLLLEGG